MWSTLVETRCSQGSPKKCAHVRRERHPPRGSAETDRQPGLKPNVRSKKWVAKDYKTHARSESHAPTTPLEALKIVLSDRHRHAWRKVVALVDVRQAHFLRLSTKKGTCLNCHPRIARRRKTCAGCYDAVCAARATPHKIGKRSWQLHSAV